MGDCELCGKHSEDLKIIQRKTQVKDFIMFKPLCGVCDSCFAKVVNYINALTELGNSDDQIENSVAWIVKSHQQLGDCWKNHV